MQPTLNLTRKPSDTKPTNPRRGIQPPTEGAQATHGDLQADGNLGFDNLPWVSKCN